MADDGCESSYEVRRQPHGRLKLVPVKQRTRCLRILCHYHNRGLETCSPTALVHHLFDAFNLDPVDFQICFSHDANLQCYLYDTGQFRMPRPARPMVKCSCSALPGCFISTAHGHLHTSSTDWIRYLGHAQLAACCDKGMHHIPCKQVDWSMVRHTCCCVAECIAQHYDLSGDLDAFMSCTSAWVDQRIAKSSHLARCQESVDMHGSAMQAAVQQVRSIVFVCGLEKATNQMYFMCKDLARELVHQQLVSSPCYSGAPSWDLESYCTALHAICPWLPAPPVARFGVVFPVFKAHKGNYRFICSMSSTTVTGLAQAMQKTCQ